MSTVFFITSRKKKEEYDKMSRWLKEFKIRSESSLHEYASANSISDGLIENLSESIQKMFLLDDYYAWRFGVANQDQFYTYAKNDPHPAIRNEEELKKIMQDTDIYISDEYGREYSLKDFMDYLGGRPWN